MEGGGVVSSVFLFTSLARLFVRVILASSLSYQQRAESREQREVGKELLVENEKVGSLHTGNFDVGSDDMQQTLHTHNVIARTKPDLLS